MNASSGLHMQMGCGEPLRSRWWVPKPVVVQPVSGRDGKPKCTRIPTAKLRHGVKSNS